MKENSCPRLFFHLKFNWYLEFGDVRKPRPWPLSLSKEPK